MIKKLLPIILLLVGAGGGIGAGMALRPAPEPMAETEDMEMKEGEEKAESSEKGSEDEAEDSEAAYEYMKMSNQFVIPVVNAEQVAALVVMSLSLEVAFGTKQDVYAREPKLRDSFLQVLFDHANVGGFDGAFTSAQNLDILRQSLREVAQKDSGDIISDVLIVDIARQDY